MGLFTVELVVTRYSYTCVREAWWKWKESMRFKCQVSFVFVFYYRTIVILKAGFKFAKYLAIHSHYIFRSLNSLGPFHWSPHISILRFCHACSSSTCVTHTGAYAASIHDAPTIHDCSLNQHDNLTLHLVSDWPLLSAGKWSSPTTTGPRPPPCYFFSFTSINDHQAVLFGGNQPRNRVVNECYLMDFESMVCSYREIVRNSVSLQSRPSTFGDCNE